MTTEQQAFEEWYGYYGFKADWSEEHGCYQDKQTQFMFAAWQASRAALKQGLLSDEMVNIVDTEIQATLFQTHGYCSSEDMEEVAKAALKAIAEEV